jgi:hypothetical protein
MYIYICIYVYNYHRVAAAEARKSPHSTTDSLCWYREDVYMYIYIYIYIYVYMYIIIIGWRRRRPGSPPTPLRTPSAGTGRAPP